MRFLLLALCLTGCPLDTVKTPDFYDEGSDNDPFNPRTNVYEVDSIEWDCWMDDPDADLDMPNDYPVHETFAAQWDLEVSWPACQCNAALGQVFGAYAREGMFWSEGSVTTTETSTIQVPAAPNPMHISWYSTDVWVAALGGVDGWYAWSQETEYTDMALGSWRASFETTTEAGDPMLMGPGHDIVQSVQPPTVSAETGVANTPCDDYWTRGDYYEPEFLWIRLVEFNENPETVESGASADESETEGPVCTPGTSGTMRARLVPVTFQAIGGSRSRARAELVPMYVSGAQMPTDAFLTTLRVSTMGSARNLYTTPAGTPFEWDAGTLTTTGLSSVTRAGQSIRFISGTQLGQSFATTTSIPGGTTWTLPEVDMTWTCPRRAISGAPQTIRLMKPPGYALPIAELASTSATAGASIIFRPAFEDGYLLAELGGAPLTARGFACDEGEDAPIDGCTTTVTAMGFTVTVYATESGAGTLDLSVLDIQRAAGETFSVDGVTFTLNPV